MFSDICYALPSEAPTMQISMNDLSRQLQNSLFEAKSKFNLTGLSVVILLPKQEILSMQLGTTQMGGKQSILPETQFQIGSITKTFTATLVAQAIKNNLLSPQDTVGKFLPEYQKWRGITIDQLVNQTSGIFDYDKTANWWPNLLSDKKRIWKSEELTNLAYQQENNFSAGKGWGYSNTNYILLGLILQKVTHKTIASLMDKLILDVNLPNTLYLPENYKHDLLGKIAHGYYDNKDDMTEQNTSWLQTAGAMISTPQDLITWMQKIISENSKEILPISSSTQLINTQTGKQTTSVNETGYRFGVFRMNTPGGIIWFTPGLTPGYTTLIGYAPCLGTFFAYSASNAQLKGFHQYMILSILNMLNANKERIMMGVKAPDYCLGVKPSEKFVFPTI